MKNYSRFAVMVIAIIAASVLAGCSLFGEDEKTKPVEKPIAVKEEVQTSKDKVYVALEEDSAVAVIDVQSKKLIKKISLDSDDGQEFMAHNVQVAPDGKSVWVTANAMKEDMHGSLIIPKAAAGTISEQTSELVVIDPLTDAIVKRIPLGVELELAHVVLAPDSKIALATSQEKGFVFVLDAERGELIKKITFDSSSEPHGIRITPDGSKAYVALMKGKAMVEISMADYTVSSIPLDGQAVQTAVTPDGKKVIVTLYDTKKLAVYTIADKTIQEIVLPEGSKGPLQLYPTLDSGFVYVADQGYYLKQPDGEKVYKVDLSTGKVVAEITAGKAPHGVVVSSDGAYIFITNLRSDDVSIIDAVSNTELVKVRVGKAPNGISYWSAKINGTE